MHQLPRRHHCVGHNKRGTRCSPQKRSYSNSCQWIETQPTQMHICCYIPYIPRSHIVSRRCAIDPSKVEAIIQMPLPESKSDLQRFMGMVNYLGKFIPNLSQITAPLRQLLKKDVLFNLQQPQLNAIRIRI